MKQVNNSSSLNVRLMVAVALVVAMTLASVSCKPLEDEKTIMANLDADLPAVTVIPGNTLGLAGKIPSSEPIAFIDPSMKPRVNVVMTTGPPPKMNPADKPSGSPSLGGQVSGFMLSLALVSALSGLLVV